MDETLTKPVQLEHLRAMLERFPPSAERRAQDGLTLVGAQTHTSA